MKKRVFLGFILLYCVSVCTLRGYCMYNRAIQEIQTKNLGTDMEIEMVLTKWGLKFDCLHRANILDYFWYGMTSPTNTR